MPSEFRNPAAPNLFAAGALLGGQPMQNGEQVMTDGTHPDAIRRNRLLEAAQKEMAAFEQRENEFGKKDREERAAELKLPLDRIKIH
jgi:hypothetical protein